MARICKTIRLHLQWLTKKNAFIFLSWFLLAIVLASLINDSVQFTVTEDTRKTTQNFTMAILFLHSLGFYLGLLAFTYSTQKAGASRSQMGWSLSAVGLHLAVFCGRIALELVILPYRTERYRVAVEQGK